MDESQLWVGILGMLDVVLVKLFQLVLEVLLPAVEVALVQTIRGIWHQLLPQIHNQLLAFEMVKVCCIADNVLLSIDVKLLLSLEEHGTQNVLFVG